MISPLIDCFFGAVFFRPLKDPGFKGLSLISESKISTVLFHQGLHNNRHLFESLGRLRMRLNTLLPSRKVSFLEISFSFGEIFLTKFNYFISTPNWARCSGTYLNKMLAYGR